MISSDYIPATRSPFLFVLVVQRLWSLLAEEHKYTDTDTMTASPIRLTPQPTPFLLPINRPLYDMPSNPTTTKSSLHLHPRRLRPVRHVRNSSVIQDHGSFHASVWSANWCLRRWRQCNLRIQIRLKCSSVYKKRQCSFEQNLQFDLWFTATFPR